jgi:hypothetical protein
MAWALAPIISTPYFFSTPLLCKAIAVLSAVWPPSVGKSTSLCGTEVEAEAALTAREARALPVSTGTPIFFISSSSRTMTFSRHSGVMGSM